MSTTTTIDLSTVAAAKRAIQPGVRLKITNHRWTRNGDTTMNRIATVLRVTSSAFYVDLPEGERFDKRRERGSNVDWPKAAGYRSEGNVFEFLDPIRNRERYDFRRSEYPIVGYGEPWITFEVLS